MSTNDSAIVPARVAVRGGGTLLAAIGVLSFSFSFPATVWALGGLGPWSVTGVRCALAALLAAACLVVARAPLPARADRPALLVVAGGCVIGFPLLTTLALETSSTAHSAVVIGLLPLATAACAALRARSRLPRSFWAAAGAGAAAVVAFALQQSGGRPTSGDLFLLAALLVCAAGYAEGGRLARRMPGWQVIAWAVLAALPATVPLTAVALAAEPVAIGGRALAGIAYVAAISQLGGFVVWYRGMAAIGVERASQVQLAQPLATLAWAALLLGEPLPPAAPLTAVAVLGCIAVTQRAGRASPRIRS